MKTHVVVYLVAVATLASANSHAIEAKDFKRVTDRIGNVIVEKYDLKEKGFGDADQRKDLELQAMIIAGLCGSPRDYREGNGPFISEPLKFIVSQIKEDGSLAAPAKDEVAALAWAAKALKSTENEKYKALVEKLHGKLKRPEAPASLEAEAQKLQQFTSLSVADQAAVLTALGHAIKDGAKTEVSVGGAKTTLGQLVLDTLHKLENNTGVVSNDLRVQALAYNLGNATYKVMK